ncbi:DUF1127 domain-containing protein [Bradyrhizobium sp. WSM2793]|uniref:DUF1127 domain-containing protein n=1 Tax=Bradyrhizobium sp. WSM2793 TaxID=1038866 RepID=UPI0012F73ACD|nr:DUF1127 domain-containing protein [Bradyrhizobium sp. WSM2793]
MSTLFADSDHPPRIRRDVATAGHQPNSWLVRLDKLLSYSERMHQRADLRAVADEPHLLADIGVTREEALEQADAPFWR